MAIELPKEFEQAELLLNQDPLPSDIIKQLNKLRENLKESEKILFDDLYDSIPIELEDLD
jgi:hypothetical protein|tara:strand:+ start:551 stop:730 length:180 start_codon:yes stop_codon:yes gene_type:complete